MFEDILPFPIFLNLFFQSIRTFFNNPIRYLIFLSFKALTLQAVPSQMHPEISSAQYRLIKVSKLQFSLREALNADKVKKIFKNLFFKIAILCPSKDVREILIERMKNHTCLLLVMLHQII